MLRHHVKDLLDLVKQPKSDAGSKAVFAKVMVITRNLPDPGKAQDFVKKLAQVLEDDERIRNQLETLVSPACSCKQAQVCVRDITKKLGSPKQPSNPFLEMVKFLLERIAPVHIDTESISALVKQVNKSIDGTADDDDEGVPTEQAIRAGLELLKVLSFTHPVSFHSAETFESLLGCLKMDDEKTKAKRGPPRQAKYAIHCIHAMFTHRDTHFAQIFEDLDQLITPLTTLGHLALLAPEQFAAPLKSLVANFIVKDLLMSDRIPGKKTTKLWVPDDEVSSETLAKIQGIKLMVRGFWGKEHPVKVSGFQGVWARGFSQKLPKGRAARVAPGISPGVFALGGPKGPVKKGRAQPGVSCRSPHPVSFHSAETFESLLGCLKMDDEKTKAKRGPPRQAKYAIHCIHAMFTHRDTHFAQIFEDLDQLITPLTTLGHLALLAPEQFAAPLKSLVANFIVKDLLMSDRIPGKKTTKLWVPDDEVSSETLAKV
ncbi:unnamed protein product [Coregonus sp. 'balchen']|nr:unnamed protein product [Coregonus sp. 'balchen']